MAELTQAQANERVARGQQLPPGWGYNPYLGAHKTTSVADSNEKAEKQRVKNARALAGVAEPEAPDDGSDASTGESSGASGTSGRTRGGSGA